MIGWELAPDVRPVSFPEGINLDVAKDSRGEGALNGLEALLDHRVVTDIKYLAAAGRDQQPSPID